MRRLAILVAGCSLACSSEKSKEPPGTGATATATPTAPARDKPAPRYTCDGVVTAAIRDKYLAGLTLWEDHQGGMGVGNMMCAFGTGEVNSFANDVMIEVSCSPYFEQPGIAGLEAILAKTKKNDSGLAYTKIDAPGRGGVKYEKRWSKTNPALEIVDSDVPCSIDVSSKKLAYEQLVSLATELEAIVK